MLLPAYLVDVVVKSLVELDQLLRAGGCTWLLIVAPRKIDIEQGLVLVLQSVALLLLGKHL